MSQLSDLVSQAIVETEKSDGSRNFGAAAALVVERSGDDLIAQLAHHGARAMCKRAAEKQGPVAKRATRNRGQSYLFPELHAAYPVDPGSNTAKLVGSLSQIEFRRIIAIREKQIHDDTAHLQQLRDAYDAVRPIWAAKPDWTFDECCAELAQKREARA